VQRPGEADVVDVVTHVAGERSVLTPAGDAPVDKARIRGEALVGTQTEPFGDSGPEPLDQHVRGRHEREYRVSLQGVLEVRGDDPTPASDAGLANRKVGRGAARPFDPNDVRTEVRHNHGRVGCWTETGELDDAQAVERALSWHGVPSGRSRRHILA
jgi:hypothetical protein